MKHQSLIECLSETKYMLNGKGYSKGFAIPMVVFVLTFTFLWYLWPFVIVGYLMATWASAGVFSIALWAAFKLLMTIILCLLVSFIGVVVTPLVHQKMKE